MKRYSNRLRHVLLLTVGVGLVWAPSAQGQEWLRPEGTFYIKPRIALSSYIGDNEHSPFNFNGDAFDIGTPWSLALEGGLQRSVPFSVGLAVQIASYPVITQYPARVLDDTGVGMDSHTRTSVHAIGRYAFAEPTTKVAPYLAFGLAMSMGSVTQDMPPNYTQEESASAFGLLLGAGLDIAMNPRTSFFVELNSGIHFGDESLDGSSTGGGGSADILSALGVGFKVNMKPAITPPVIFGTTCPTGNVVAGQEAGFSAMTNGEFATQPYEMRWDFGGGAVATGESATHTFSDEGTHTVTFTFSNEGGSVSYNCDVNVIIAAAVVNASVNKSTVSICDEDPSVQFTANVRGSAPLTYSWDFGDGNTSNEASPTHTYSDMGAYTVTLTLTNEGGTDSGTVTVTVNDEGCFNCDIAEMNTVFFDRNSSVLTDAGRQELEDNVEILQNCTLNVRIEGHASADERMAQDLSEARARAVAQVYMDNGVSEDRMTVTGMGPSGEGAKKSGMDMFRRVDTIPVQ